MGAPERSVSRTLSSGVVRRFSSRQDFLDYYREKSADLSDDADLRWVDVFQSWVQQGATGCRFAQHRAKHAQESQFLSIILQRPLQEHMLLDLQEILLSSADAQAVLLLVPSISHPSELATLLRTFNESDYWNLDILKNTTEEVLVGLRWPIPSTLYVSEVLGFGPFDCLPVTRRAPICVLALRTHPPQRVEENRRVHLAQMPLFELELRDDKAEYFWNKTSEMRKEILAGQLEHAAKAKVTARFTSADWSPVA